MDPMRRRRKVLGHSREHEPLQHSDFASFTEDRRSWAEEQVRKFAELEGECPLLLAARTRRVIEHVLNVKPGNKPWGDMADRVNMADPMAAVVAACVLWNKVPPAFVVHFLDEISDAASLTAKALYLRLVQLMQDELGEEAPRASFFEEECDNLPSLRLNWSAEERLVFATPPSQAEAVSRGTDLRANRQKEQHILRRGLPRPWFGADSFQEPQEEDLGQLKRPRRPAKKGNLPILERKSEIMRLVQQNQVVLLQGETGCGKTTQVPQFILEMAREAQLQEPDRPVRIVCTQPRRIAAISVAQRVADERGEVLGEGAIGYKIRGCSVAGKDCELLFCTTGVLLRRLVYEGRKWMFSPKTVTHLLVDEVHERTADTDFLLTFLRDVSMTRPNLRVVLMSATLDTKSFLRFFSVSRGGRVIAPPTIHIKGFMYPVAEIYLETIALKGGYHKALEAQSPGQVWSSGQKIAEGIDCQLLAQLIDQIFWSEHGPWDFVTERQVREENQDKWATAKGGAESKGAILVFLPGMAEINELMSSLKMQRSAGKLWVLPLHASLPPDEQQLCFETLLPQGYETKVICATNVAETSVTVPDVVVVIDTCRQRLSTMEKGSQVASLKLQWCAQDSLRQRRGRAGRVQPGVAFRLILQEDMEKLEETTPPEMTRTPLEQLYLQSCVSGIADVPSFLLRTPDPPTKLAVQFAETCLHDIGALDDGAPDKLSHLGRMLGAMPTHPRIGKMLILGCLLGCPHETLSIGAIVMSRSPLLQLDSRRNEWNAAREELRRTVGFVSDHLVVALLLSDWEQLNVGQRRQMAQKYGIAFDRMNEALRERQLLAECLVNTGFLPTELCREKIDSRTRAKWPLVVAAVVGGLYPNIVFAERVGERCYSNDLMTRAHSMRYQVMQRHHSKMDAMSYPKPLHMHQASVCFGADDYHCPYFAYFAAQQTAKLYCYDATEVTPWSVLLMAEEEPLFEQTESTSHVVVGGWTKFECTSPSIMPIIGALRSAWRRVLERKLQEPHWEHTESRELVVVKRLLLDQGAGFELAR